MKRNKIKSDSTLFYIKESYSTLIYSNLLFLYGIIGNIEESSKEKQTSPGGSWVDSTQPKTEIRSRGNRE